MNDLTERVVNTAKRLEDTDDPQAIDYLEYSFNVQPDATVNEVTLVLTTGGPQIEVNCLNGTVTGFWSGERHTTHVESEAVKELGYYLADSFEEEYRR
jgi:hypothetical protein